MTNFKLSHKQTRSKCDLFELEVTADFLEACHRGEMDFDLLIGEKDKLGRNKASCEAARARRMAIYYFYTQVYDSAPEDSGSWDGKDGIPARIAKQMMLKPGADLRPIKNCMRLIKKHQEKNRTHDGSAEPRKEWGCYYIPLDSCEAQLIADPVEAEFGFTETTHFVNLCREEQGKPHVGRSCVCQKVKRMEPQVKAMVKRPQGSHDLNSAWCRANCRFAVQLLLRFGAMKVKDTPKEFLKKDRSVPDCFNPSLLDFTTTFPLARLPCCQI